MKGIVKVYPPDVLALDNVDISISQGDIHSIIGENGAGKSTLMKLLYGLTTANSGSISIGGKDVRFTSPRQAVQAGIGMVHQEFMLIPSYTVWENVVLGAEPVTRTGAVRSGHARALVAEHISRWGLNLDPDAVVGELSVGAQQKVEILKLLYRDVQVLIMDEPTAVLTPQEASELFTRLTDLNRSGRTIVFISHKLDEVLDISRNITIMRKGKRVVTVPNSGLNKADLARAMVGRDVVLAAARGVSSPGEPVLEVEGLSVPGRAGGRPRLDNVSLTVRRGEIVGVAGVEGNGQFELVQAIAGLVKPSSGLVVMSGCDVTHSSVMDRRRFMCSVPQDRKFRGSAQQMSIANNSVMTHHRLRPSLSARVKPLLNPSACRDFALEVIERFSVVAPGPDVAIGQLSGGNQQKVIVGREFMHDVNFILLDNPTRGLDVGSIEFIQEEIVRRRDQGSGCLLVSADLDELLALCDRIVVMYGGRIAAVFDGESAKREQVGQAMLGLEPRASSEVAKA